MDDELKQAEMGWAAAVKKMDQPTIAKMLSEDLIYTHSSGVVESKAEYLKALSSGNQKYDGIEHMNPAFRTYGNTGVVNSKVRMTGSTKGVPFDNQLLMMHVWVKKDGGWQLVAHQTTKLP